MESSWPGITDLFSSGFHGPWAPLEKAIKKKKKKKMVTCTLSLKDKKTALVISFFLLTPIVSVLIFYKFSISVLRQYCGRGWVEEGAVHYVELRKPWQLQI